MNVLVTGGGGFLGSYIVKELLKRNHTVKNLSRNSYVSLEEQGVETYKVDLSNPDSLDKVDFNEFDYIIHVAAKAGVWGSYSSYYNANFLATKNIVEKAKKADKLKGIIYTSTPSVVFGEDDIMGGDESMAYPKKYYTHYAKTKSMAESLLLEANDASLKTLAIRPHLIWGPGDPHLFPRLIAKAKSGDLRQVGDGENIVDIVYVENAAIAHVDAMEALETKQNLGGEAYFIGQDEPVKLWDFLNTVLLRADIEKIDDRISYKAAYYIGAVLEFIYKLFGIISPEPKMTRFVAMQLAKSHYFSHQKARDDFGYSCKVSTEEGLNRYFKES